MSKLSKGVNLYVFLIRTIGGIFIYGGFLLLLLIPKTEFQPTYIKTILVSVASLLVAIYVTYNIVLAFMTYKYYEYEVTEERVTIQKGILFKKTIILPIKRIQHAEKMQGPIQILMKQASVRIFTAGSVETIFGLSLSQSNELLDELNNLLDRHLKDEEEANEEV